MRTLISYTIRDAAGTIKLAEAFIMDKNLMDHAIEVLKDTLEDKKNFDPSKPGLTFSKAGRDRIRAIHPELLQDTFLNVIKKIDSAIKTNLHRESRFKFLNIYLDRTFRDKLKAFVVPESYEAAKEALNKKIMEPFERGLSLMQTAEKDNISKREIEEGHRDLEKNRKLFKKEELEQYQDLKNRQQEIPQ